MRITHRLGGALALACVLSSCDCSKPPALVDGGTDAGAAAGALLCDQPGHVICGDQCVDPASNAANCGGCGHACASTESCVNSTCFSTTCATTPCAATEICVDDHCRQRQCVGVVCPASSACA